MTNHTDPSDPFASPKPIESRRVFGVTGIIILFPVVGFVFGKVGALTYLAMLIIAATVATWLMPRDPHIKLARCVATVLVVVATILMFVSGLPLQVAIALHPVGQSLQDDRGDAGISTLIGWVVVMIVLTICLAVLSGKLYFSKTSAPKVLLSALVLAIAIFPVVGVIAQELALHGWS